ncbi:hypothetical protein MAR_007589 [Mya arenaria]|uniref:Helitron helicase-like domain-containing protein n=1 Tax=Mya arenaria TaxID=6604 RepID=A0ABY7DCU2_MYAAR|nr:hypothetical protein MAR_007589 [Mya arenaria]
MSHFDTLEDVVTNTSQNFTLAYDSVSTNEKLHNVTYDSQNTSFRCGLDVGSIRNNGQEDNNLLANISGEPCPLVGSQHIPESEQYFAVLKSISDHTHDDVTKDIAAKDVFVNAKYHHETEHSYQAQMNNSNDLIENDVTFHVGVAAFEVVTTTHWLPNSNNSAENNVVVHLSAVDASFSEYYSFNRCLPNKWCCSCDRFLFPNQVKHLGCGRNNGLIMSLNLDSTSDLCSTCLRYLAQSKIQSICSKLKFSASNLYSWIGKNLLALIQVCMTLVILPGGQYAEKGLVVDLPRDVHTLVEGLAKFDNLCIVHFEHDNAVGSSGRSQKNNRLYSESSTCDFENFQQHSSDARLAKADGVPVRGVVNSMEQITLAPVDYSGPSERICTNTQQSSAEYATFVLPSNNNTPVSVYEIPSGEEKAFPWLFPQGEFGYSYPRPTALNPTVSYDKLLLRREIGICMKMSKGSSGDGHSQSSTAGDVRARNNNPDILQNYYMFMKNIRGTMFRCLGPPTLFMTLSADDLHWPELGMLMRSDPLLTAIHFDRRFTALMKFIIYGQNKPLGEVVDFFARQRFSSLSHIFVGEGCAT